METGIRAVRYLTLTDPGGTAAVRFDGPPAGTLWQIGMFGAKTSQVTETSVYLGEDQDAPPAAVQNSAWGASGYDVVFTWPPGALVLDEPVPVVIAVRSGTLVSARLHVKQVSAEWAAAL